MEIRPAGVGLGGGLDAGVVVAREVGEEVQACPLLYLVHAHHVFGVVVVLCGLVLPVDEPEADGLGGCNAAVSFALNLEYCLPIIIGNGQLCGIRALAAGSLQVVDNLSRVANLLVVCRTGDHVYRIRRARNETAHSSLKSTPDAAVELILQLRRLVGGVVGLEIHGVIALAAGVGTLMPARIAVVAVHRAVAVADDVHLSVVGNVGIVSPARSTGATALVRAAERIGHPEGRIVGIAIVVAVVTVRSRIASAAVELTNEVFSTGHLRQLQPA